LTEELFVYGRIIISDLSFSATFGTDFGIF
jgi:hypothetical protein